LTDEAALRPISRRRDTTGSWEAAGETAAGSPKGETSGSERVKAEHRGLADVASRASGEALIQVEALEF